MNDQNYPKLKHTLSLREWNQRQTLENIQIYEMPFAVATSIEEAVFINRFAYWMKEYGQGGKAPDGFYIKEDWFCRPIGLRHGSFVRIIKRWEELKIFTTKRKGTVHGRKRIILNEGRYVEYLNLLYAFGSNYLELMRTPHKTKKIKESLQRFLKCTSKISNMYFKDFSGVIYNILNIKYIENINSFSPNSVSEINTNVESCTNPSSTKRRKTSVKEFTKDSSSTEWYLCEFLMEKVKANDDHYRKAYDDPAKLTLTYQKWCKDWDKLLRLDGRSVIEIQNLISWLFEPEQRQIGYNCLSPGKLRKNWDRYMSNMLRSNPDQKFKNENKDLITGLANVFCRIQGITEYIPTKKSSEIYTEGAKNMSRRFFRRNIPREEWLLIVEQCLRAYIENGGLFGEWIFAHTKLWNELIPVYLKEEQ